MDVEYRWLHDPEDRGRLLKDWEVWFEMPYWVFGAKDRKTGEILGYMVFDSPSHWHMVNVKRGVRTQLSDKMAREGLKANFQQHKDVKHVTTRALSMEGRQDALEKFCQRIGGERVDPKDPRSRQFIFHRHKFVK